MFTKEGSFMAKVKDAVPSEPQEWRKGCGPNDFEACLFLEVAYEDGAVESDWWRGLVSGNFCRIKNKEHMTEAQVTLDALHSVGFEGQDFATFDTQMVGKSIPITNKLGKPNKDQKVYMNTYLGSFAPIAMDKAEAARRAAALFSNAGFESSQQRPTTVGGAAAPASAPAAATSAPINPPRIATGNNPFARKQQ
jgi:hypothetical protein